ncbi:hypothetical protein M8C21_012130 [Ambrosia artemisiifolia]|uniref:Uncharacterized protein n=1 Tax=Ambrosia artemisiifolia TaxID=4212 RepID=A0AAD5C9R5_AMBAR|nr:hypothetical protein M8C21_012130 [Ambrosia artemisiifolia]
MLMRILIIGETTKYMADVHLRKLLPSSRSLRLSPSASQELLKVTCLVTLSSLSP